MDIFKKYTADFVNKVIDNADVLILYLEPNGNISICNKKTEVLVAKNKEQIIGNSWLDVLYTFDNAAFNQKQMFKAMVDDSIIYKRSNNFDGLITNSNKDSRLVCWSITPILSENNDLEGTLLIGSDITASKEREASLRKIDETLKNIFSSIKEYALFVVNLDGNITYFGMGSEMMFGWSKNEIIFKHVSLLLPKDNIELQLPFILNQVNQFGEFEVELEMLKKDTHTFPVILTVSKFIDSEFRHAGYIFIAKDMTERKKLEYQIIQSEKLAAIGQLAAGITHDINNPLFVISGRLEMMLMNQELDKDIKRNLQTINEQATRIKRLVDQLLKFSRKTPGKFETLNINEVIESVLPLLAYHKLSISNIAIKKDFSKDIGPIKGDLNQLQEVFVNLFINALESMPEGGTLSIRTCNLPSSHVEITVSDTGRGIAAGNLKNIFMPFFSTKKEGTGLGLSICYNIIKNHQGSIEIESKLSKGTTFVIKFPVIKD